MKKKQVAVIDVGSSAIRLTVAEMDGRGSWQVLEQANKPIQLGRDVFMDGRISRTTTHEAIQILAGFLELSKAYGAEEVLAVGTSCLREAQNRNNFLDLVSLHAGIRIRVIEEGEELRYIYLAALHGLGEPALASSGRPAAVLEVGAGNTHLLLMKGGTVEYARTLDLGTIRMIRELSRGLLNASSFSAFQERIAKTIRSLNLESDLRKSELIVGIGGDLRLAADRLGLIKNDAATTVSLEELNGYIQSLAKYLGEEERGLLDFEEEELESLLSALLVYDYLLRTSAAEQVIVPWVSISDGVLLDFALRLKGADWEKYRPHFLASARSVAGKYRADLVHADKVSQYALRVFDALKEDFALEPRQRLFLEIAALVHDIGKYVSLKEHHRHGQYLIESETIFGLLDAERSIVGNLIRYHYGEALQRRNRIHGALSQEDQVGIAKMAAILRLAEALDRGHEQKIVDFTLEKTEMDLVIRADTAADIAVEKIGVLAQSDMFEDVFGLKLILV